MRLGKLTTPSAAWPVVVFEPPANVPVLSVSVTVELSLVTTLPN